MPFIEIKTNVKIKDSFKDRIKTFLGEEIVTLGGKSESWLMIDIKDEECMYFKGSEKPTAMIRVSTYGECNPSDMEKFCKNVTFFIYDNLNITKDRIYVSFFSTDSWGFNGEMF